MGKISVIAVKDFKTYFISPIGYLVISTFLFIIGYMFYQRLILFVRETSIREQFGQQISVSLNSAIIKPLYGTMNLLFLFIIPLITMRLLSEEKKNKTMELLITSPINSSDIIIGKYLSSLAMIVLTLLLSLVYPIILYTGGNPDMGQVFTMFVGLILISSCYISLGIFWSSLTENQIIAAVLTFISLLFFWIIDWAAQNAGQTTAQIISYLSIIRHFESFMEGTINLKDVIYYLSFTSFTLYLSYFGIETKNWK